MTKLEQWRNRRGVSQDRLAAAVGVSRTTYQRLERGDHHDPRLRILVNCALALGCELSDLIEDEWREWYEFDVNQPKPPDPKTFWRSHD